MARYRQEDDGQLRIMEAQEGDAGGQEGDAAGGLWGKMLDAAKAIAKVIAVGFAAVVCSYAAVLIVCSDPVQLVLFGTELMNPDAVPAPPSCVLAEGYLVDGEGMTGGGELACDLMIDTETRVQYLLSADGGGFLCPVLDADGTPVLADIDVTDRVAMARYRSFGLDDGNRRFVIDDRGPGSVSISRYELVTDEATRVTRLVALGSSSTSSDGWACMTVLLDSDGKPLKMPSTHYREVTDLETGVRYHFTSAKGGALCPVMGQDGTPLLSKAAGQGGELPEGYAWFCGSRRFVVDDDSHGDTYPGRMSIVTSSETGVSYLYATSGDGEGRRWSCMTPVIDADGKPATDVSTEGAEKATTWAASDKDGEEEGEDAPHSARMTLLQPLTVAVVVSVALAWMLLDTHEDRP